jgi:hypothetical protein
MSYSNLLILFPEGRFADSVHVPTIEALNEPVARTRDTFERGADRLLGTKQEDFAKMSQNGKSSGNSGDAKGPLKRQAKDERNPRPDRPDTDPGEVRDDFAAHFRNSEVFNENAAGITTGSGQAQEATSQVIVLHAAHVTALIREGFGDGVVEGHALLAHMQALTPVVISALRASGNRCSRKKEFSRGRA